MLVNLNRFKDLIVVKGEIMNLKSRKIFSFKYLSHYIHTPIKLTCCVLHTSQLVLS